MGKYGRLGGGALLVLIGLGMIEMGVTDPEFSVGSMIFMVVCALLFVAVGVLLVYIAIIEFKEDKKSRLASGGGNALDELKGELKDALIPGYSVTEDKTELERKLTSFREHYASFFALPVPMENAPVQLDTTQVYRNILEFRRNRLRKLGLVCEYESARKNYGGYSISKKESFDGKYQITEVSEDIAAKTSYLKDGRKIYSKTDRQIARYVLLNAKATGANKVICPNCGAAASREDLIDGCDSCGTKFIIEDLGLKVSDFAYRADPDVQYEKYKAVRKKLNIWLSVAIGLIIFIWSSYWMIKVAPEVASETNSGPIMSIMVTILGILFVTAGITFVAVFMFDILIFPWIQIFMSSSYMSKLMIRKLEKAARDDSTIQNQVRKTDKLFSVNAFYCGIQNKLSAIHFADTANQINAFTTFDLSDKLNKYKDVVDIDTQFISLRNYHVDGNLQVAEVEAYLILTEYKNGKCKAKKERLMLMLSKSAACKTQTICGPSLMRCKSCGNGLTLLNGRQCPQCGTDIYLEQYDWVIRGYKAT